jgi:hypothetical protein
MLPKETSSGEMASSQSPDAGRVGRNLSCTVGACLLRGLWLIVDSVEELGRINTRPWPTTRKQTSPVWYKAMP